MAEIVNSAEILGLKLCCAVVHHNDLVKESCGLVLACVVLFKLLLEVLNVVGANRDYLPHISGVSLLSEVLPKTAEGLCEYRGTVVVTRDTVSLISHNEEYGCSALVLGSVELGRELIEASEHHLYACLDCKRACLKVDNAVENALLGRSDDSVGSLVVAGENAVCRLNYSSLVKSGHVSAGVVVGCVKYAELASVVDKLVARKGVSERRVVVLTLTDKVELAVLTESEAAKSAKGCCALVLSFSESVGGSTVVVVGEHRLNYLSSYEVEKRVVLSLRLCRIENYLLVCYSHSLIVAHLAEESVCLSNVLHIASADESGK